MKKVIVGCMIQIVLILCLMVDSFSAEYQFQGQGINGMPFAGRNTGLIKLSGSPPMDAYCLDMDTLLVEGAYYKVQSYDNDRIKSILNRVYPIEEDLPRLQAELNAWLEEREITPVEGINIEVAVTAAQIAIWHIACSLDIGLLDSEAKDEVKLAHYLLATDSMKAELPVIEIEVVNKTFSPSTQTFDATFTYRLSDQDGQASIHAEKTYFSGLPESAEETVFVNGGTYTRVVRGIPAGTVLVLRVNAQIKTDDICRLISETSQELVGIRTKTIELNKYISEDFSLPSEPNPSAAFHDDFNSQEIIRLPIEAAYGLAILIAALVGLILKQLLRPRKKNAARRNKH